MDARECPRESRHRDGKVAIHVIGAQSCTAIIERDIMYSSNELYANRKLSEGFPDLNQLAHRAFSHSVLSRVDETQRLDRMFTYLGRLIEAKTSRNIVVLGCGPHPEPIACLVKMGHKVIGIEPIESFVETAGQFLGDSAKILRGSAESIPLPDSSQDIVVFEAVLEHVDSIPKSLNEIYRVLAPGGVLYLETRNRHQFSIKGKNGEFNIPFYNWFPRLVQECYVFKHLHYEPGLANYTERPAVHWLSFADLCSRGRDAGFSQFYSILDLIRSSDPSITKSWLRRTLLPYIQRNPWIRAIALTQVGGWIAMLKRN